MGLDFFESLFDMDGDGKITDADHDLDHFLFRKTMGDDHSWRENCEDGFDYGVDPNDYETLDDYMTVLEEEKYGWRFGHTEGEEYGIFPDDYETEEEYINAVAAAEENNPVDLGLKLNISFGYREEEEEKCEKFIKEKSDTVLAARYLSPIYGFLYAQAIKDNFELPCSLPDEKDKREMRFYEIMIKIARYDIPLALKIWKWCVDEFSPYAEYEDYFAPTLSDYVFKERYSFKDYDEILSAIVEFLHDDPEFCKKVMSLNDEYSPAISDYIGGALERDYYSMAKYLFKKELDKANGYWKDVNDFTNKVILEAFTCGVNNIEALEYFRDYMLPYVAEIKDGMVQDEIPEFEEQIQDYIEQAIEKHEYDKNMREGREKNRRLKKALQENAGKLERYKENPKEFKKNEIKDETSWRENCVFGKEFGVNPADFETFEEYADAVKNAMKNGESEMMPSEDEIWKDEPKKPIVQTTRQENVTKEKLTPVVKTLDTKPETAAEEKGPDEEEINKTIQAIEDDIKGLTPDSVIEEPKTEAKKEEKAEPEIRQYTPYQDNNYVANNQNDTGKKVLIAIVVAMILLLLYIIGNSDNKKSSYSSSYRTTRHYYTTTTRHYTTTTRSSYNNTTRSSSGSGTRRYYEYDDDDDDDYYEDEYDVEDYADAQEFYYWHRDDFADYEEAEDYFNEYN